MNNLHLHIQPQLESIIDDLIFQGHTEHGLQSILVDTNNWYESSPYQYSIIHTDGMEGTFKHLLRLVDIITGDNRAFNLDLIEQLGTTIEARWEIRLRHMQEDMENEARKLKEQKEWENMYSLEFELEVSA